MTKLSARFIKLLDAFGGDSTEEIVAATALARDGLQRARTEQSRLREMLIVEENGAGLAELFDAIHDMQAARAGVTQPTLFVVRARISHAAKSSGFSATFHEENRRAEVRCVGHGETVWFSCVPSRPGFARDLSGRFISRQ